MDKGLTASHLPCAPALPRPPGASRNVEAAKLLTRIPMRPHAAPSRGTRAKRSNGYHAATQLSQQRGAARSSNGTSLQSSQRSLSAGPFSTLGLTDCWQDDDASLLRGMIDPSAFQHPTSGAHLVGVGSSTSPSTLQLDSSVTNGTEGIDARGKRAAADDTHLGLMMPVQASAAVQHCQQSSDLASPQKHGECDVAAVASEHSGGSAQATFHYSAGAVLRVLANMHTLGLLLYLSAHWQ